MSAKSRVVAVAVLALAASAAPRFTMRAAQAPDARRSLHAPRTVWDSVYTEEQAQRGQVLFRNACERCHGETLKGIDDAPPLAGSAFIAGWEGKTLKALFERINSSMPSDDPGTLTKAQIADAVAYILKFGAFPAGAAELPGDPEQLIEIKIVATKSP